MAGVEVFGLIASAAQLAEAGAKISTGIAEICRRVHNSPKELRSYADSTQQLIDTAKLIQPFDQDFRFPALTQHLRTTLDEARSLHKLISKVVQDYSQGSVAKRYWKAARGSNESEILHGLRRIEQEKNSLIICLNFATTKQIVMLQASIDTIAEDMAKGRGNSRETKNEEILGRVSSSSSLKELQDQFKLALTNTTNESYELNNRKTDISAGIAASEKQREDIANKRIPSRAQLPQRRKRNEGDMSSKTNGHTYRRIKIGTGITSVQGNVGDYHLISHSRNFYSDIELNGKGIAIIGNMDGESFKTMLSSR